MIGCQIGPSWRRGLRGRCSLMALAMVLLAVLLLVGCSGGVESAPRGQAVDASTPADFDFTSVEIALKVGGVVDCVPKAELDC